MSIDGDGSTSMDSGRSRAEAHALQCLQSLVDAFELGIGDPRTAPELAMEALVAGLDSEALVDLAGLHNEEPRVPCVEPLLIRLVLELPLAAPEEAASLVRLATATSGEILAGTIEPIAGARTIWNLTRVVERPAPVELHPFIYAASEWDERPGLQDALTEGICAAARSLAGAAD